MHVLDGWLPLRGRWLRYAALGLAAPPVAFAVLFLLVVGNDLTVFLPLGAAICAGWPNPYRSSQTGGAQACAALGCWILSFWLGNWSLQVGLSYFGSRGGGCGTCAAGQFAELLGQIPVFFLVPLALCRIAGSSHLAGMAARIPTLSALIVWLTMIAARWGVFQ